MGTAKYREFKTLNLPETEKEILEKWGSENTFEKSVSLRKSAPQFVFYEGPPSANGMPGIHHVIARTLKDLVCRYKTMQGYQVRRKGGWDTHGLPIELGVEKELGITKEDIGKKISVEEYNEKCREAVLRFKDKWDELTVKMGYWVDLEDPYITFKNSYIETLWWILKNLYNKNLLYESVSIQPYSPAAGTGLSSHELNQPGTYKDVKDTSAVAMFALTLKGNNENHKGAINILEAIKKYRTQFPDTINIEESDEQIYFLAWTTTPWTLPSNLGLTVGANIKYSLIRTKNPYTNTVINVILAKELIKKYFDTFESFGTEIYEGSTTPPTHNSATDSISASPFVDKNDLIFSVDKRINSRFIIEEFLGSELEGIEYEQLLPFESNSLKIIEEETPNAKPFRVLLGDFVTTEDGTGIVHTAPAFGADDFKVGKKYNIGILTMVDKRGRFLPGIKDDVFLYGDEYVKEEYLTDAEKETEFKKQKQILEAHGKVKDLKKYISVDDRIVLKLQEEGKLFKKEKYEHSYPHCWRTDKPILYYPLDAWFIRTTALKDKMVELNKTINWKPKSTGEGRFGNWLENMVDWNLSRSRFWGTPLPIWKTEDGEEEKCIGTIEELLTEVEKSKKAGILNSTFNIQHSTLDLHKPFVDEIILVSESGKPMKRVPDLIDVWFDSGAMPYAQWGLDYDKIKAGDPMPFGAGWEGSYPADFIAEGVDQTRGWFYTLHAISSLLYENVAYKTVVSNGLALDKNGNKMSKRLGNMVNPFETIETYGADATRWYLITNASPWDNLKFDIDGIKEAQRKFFGTLYNTYQFFVLYANVDGFAFKEDYIPVAERPEIDRWILSSLHTLIKKTTAAFDEYEPTIAGRLIEEFVDEHLSNWYVRLCRRRFWKGEYEHDKICAYQTLYECLETILLLMAPVSPFFSDAIFQNLNAVSERLNVASVHHANYPVANETLMDAALEERMQLAQDACSLVLSLRKKVNLKVRQPLQKILIPVLDAGMKEQIKLVENLILAEVNVKEIEYIGETEGFIKKKIKANFKTLGAKLGANMKEAAGAISNFTQHQIAELEQTGAINFQLSTFNFQLSTNDVEITAEDIPGWSVASKGALTVALDISLTDELKKEGNAREFVNRIQTLRKENRFELTDRISVDLLDNSEMKNSLETYKNYICAEILAESLNWVPQMQDGIFVEVNDVLLKLTINKKR